MHSHKNHVNFYGKKRNTHLHACPVHKCCPTFSASRVLKVRLLLPRILSATNSPNQDLLIIACSLQYQSATVLNVHYSGATCVEASTVTSYRFLPCFESQKQYSKQQQLFYVVIFSIFLSIFGLTPSCRSALKSPQSWPFAYPSTEILLRLACEITLPTTTFAFVQLCSITTWRCTR